ncbi:MAG: 16S rRNA (adenine(1518)-N(6)/adenine(1519)-N(6))-dimethyltransferase RsmA [Gemmatimonadota bacterium]
MPRGKVDPRPRAKRSLGQNFLVDPNIQRAVVEALELTSADEVVEIGPGRGALTQHLAGRVARLVCIELDDALAAELTARYSADESVDVVHADFLRTGRDDVGPLGPDFKIVGNLPYNRTSPMLFRILSAAWRPALAVLMVQREVADRIVAPPGTKTYGALSVGTRVVAEVDRVFNVSPGAFRPAPDVHSSVIRLRPHRPPRLSPAEEEATRTLTRAAFARRRKQFQRVLRDAPEYRLTPDRIEALERQLGVDLSARPETFAPAQFVALARALGEATRER